MGMTDAPSDLDTLVKESWTRFLVTYEPLRPRLYRYCRYLTKSPWDAEDLTQDTLARAFATLPHLADAPRAPQAWLFKIASNLWIDRMRKGESAFALGEEAANVDPRAMREAAGTLLLQLAPQERAAVVLKEVFDLSLEEIAEVLSTTAGAIKAALHRGREKLEEPREESPRALVPGVLDAFCAAFNAGDMETLTALLLENATVEVVGATMIYGRARAQQTALPGMVFGARRMAAVADGGTGDGIDPRFAQGVLPIAARIELRVHRGEVLLLSFYAHHDGEFVRALTRVTITGEMIAEMRNYFFTPEIIEEVCTELDLPWRANGTFRARGEG